MSCAALLPHLSRAHARPCVCAAQVRVFAAGAGFKRVLAAPFPWAVNYATLQPGGHVVAVVRQSGGTGCGLR